MRLRTRLVSLGMLATAPALVVIIYTQSLERQRARQRTETDIRQVTVLSASREATVFDGVQRLLSTLAQLPEIQAADPARCKALLPRLLRDHAGYINIWVVKHDKPFCAAIPLDPAPRAGNPQRSWYKQAAATRSTAVSDFQMSPVNGKPDVGLAHPIINGAGDVEGIVAAAISLDPLNDIAARAQLPDGTTLTMFDRHRRILARYPAGPASIGQLMPDARPSSLFASAPVQGGIDTGLQIAMEVDGGAAMAQANSLLRQHAVLLAVLLIATAVMSLAGSERFVRRPIAELADVTKRLATGDLSARATVHGAPGVDDLADAINAMATDMEARARAESRAQAELRASEERLRHVQKLETVGQLAAGVAHNFNNLLTVIAGFTELLVMRHPDGADRNDLEEIRKAAQRGALLTRQLLAFSRRQEAAPAKLDLNETVAELRDMLARVIREDITLDISPSPAPAWVLIDPHEVEQIVLNLVLNGRDAMSSGGSIRIGISQVMLHAGMAAAQPPPSAGWYMRIAVADTGTGIPPEILAHLFEPFFTTKDAGKGTGMGLASVDAIVRANRGAITVDTLPGKGTTFSVYFPAVPADFVAPSRSSADMTAVSATASTTVLLVEDEDPLRAVVARMLAQAGYRVLDARTPTEACQLFAEHQQDIALLLTDVVMPEMNGPALAQRLVGLQPELRVLFVSGYTEELPVLDAPGTKSRFLAKPFTAATLLAAISELLEARAWRGELVGRRP